MSDMTVEGSRRSRSVPLELRGIMYVIQYRDKYEKNPDNWKSWSSAHELDEARRQRDAMKLAQKDSDWRIWYFETREEVV